MRIRASVPKWLAAKTFRVEYSPNCASPWLVRLVGYRQAYIDGRSYSPMGLDLTEEMLTDDAIGFGKSLAEAAKNALKHYENQKRLAEEQPSPGDIAASKIIDEILAEDQQKSSKLR